MDAVQFQFALGDNIRDRDTGVNGVVTSQIASRQGAGYWVTYLDANEVAQEAYIPEAAAEKH